MTPLMFEANGKYSQKDPYGYNQGTTSKLGWSYSEERYYNASYQEILNFISSLLLLCFVGATAPMRRALRHLFPIVGQWVNYCMDLFISTQIMYDLLDLNNHICLCLRCDFIEWWRFILDYSNVTMSEWRRMISIHEFVITVQMLSKNSKIHRGHVPQSCST